MTPEILEQCDPGIRPVLRWLWANNFETSDSGDGVTKEDDEGVIRVPHVALKLEQGLSIITYCNAGVTLDLLAMRFDGEYHIEVTRSFPDHYTSIIFFPSPEWIESLESSQK